MPPFTREELCNLGLRANHMANVEGINPVWRRAYLQLADAADRLDAMVARCTVDEAPVQPVEVLLPITDDALVDLLGLVMQQPDKLPIGDWTQEQKEEAADWADAVHLHASDNPVAVPERPDCIPEEALAYVPQDGL